MSKATTIEPVIVQRKGEAKVYRGFPAIPVAGSIVFIPCKEKPLQTGKIVLAETAEKQGILVQVGIVVAVSGPYLTAVGQMYAPMIEPGDMIFFRQYEGTELRVEGRAYQTITENNVTAFIPAAEVDPGELEDALTKEALTYLKPRTAAQEGMDGGGPPIAVAVTELKED